MTKIWVFLLAFLTAACASDPSRVQAARAIELWKSSLAIHSSVEHTELLAGQQLRIPVRLVNTGNERLRVCLLSKGANVNLSNLGLGVREDARFIKTLSINGTGVHPQCGLIVNLRHDQTFELSQDVTIPLVPPGPAELTVAIQLMAPDSCNDGCEFATLTTSVPVSIIAPNHSESSR